MEERDLSFSDNAPNTERSPDKDSEKSSAKESDMSPDKESNKESQSSSDERLERVKRKAIWRQSPLMKRRKFDDSGSPSTTSIESVESVVSLVEASSVKKFSVFKDWIESKFFVFTTNGQTDAIIKCAVKYTENFDLWPSKSNCALCKSGDVMRTIVEHVEWHKVLSDDTDIQDIDDTHSKEIFAKARNAFSNNFQDDEVKDYLLVLMQSILRNCCCTHHLSRVKAYIPTSMKRYLESSLKMEVWEQLAGGEVGDRTIDDLILSGFPDCAICISINNHKKIVIFVIEAKNSNEGAASHGSINLDSSSIGQLCFYLNALGLKYYPESIPLLGLYTEGHKGRLCWAQLQKSSLSGRYNGLGHQVAITINSHDIDIMTTQGIMKISQQLMNFIQCYI